MVLKKMFAIESDPNHTQDLVWTYQIFQVIILSQFSAWIYFYFEKKNLKFYDDFYI